MLVSHGHLESQAARRPTRVAAIGKLKRRQGRVLEAVMDQDVLADEERRLVDGEDDSCTPRRRWRDGLLGRHVSGGGAEARCDDSRPEAGSWHHGAQIQYEPKSMAGIIEGCFSM